MELTIGEHIRRARRYEQTAAVLTVRGLQDVQSPEPFWCLAEVHRAVARKMQAART